MKKQFRIIDVGKGVINITPLNLHEVYTPIVPTDISDLSDDEGIIPEPVNPDDFVDKTSDENVGGVKTFLKPLNANPQEVEVANKNKHVELLNYNGTPYVRVQTQYYNNGYIGTKGVGIGYNALLNSAGGNCYAIGESALKNNTQYDCLAIGYSAGENNTGHSSVGIGRYALQNNAGFNSTGIGNSALTNNTGNEVTGIGSQAANMNTANNVTAIGGSAARNNTGYGNVAVGNSTMYDNTGAYAVAVGTMAARNNTQSYIVAVGYNAMYDNTGMYSTAVGYDASKKNIGHHTAGVGAYALRYNRGGYSVALGNYALENNVKDNNVGIGYNAARFNTGQKCIAVGSSALANNIGNDNIVIGSYSFNMFQEDSANEKTFTDADVDVSQNRITINGHGFGSTNSYVALKYVSIDGTQVGGIGSNNVYIFKVVDSNTLEVYEQNIFSAGSGNNKLVPQIKYDNVIILGGNINPTKSNQIILGNNLIDEVVTHGDYEVLSSGKGVILKSPDGNTRVRVSVDNSGNLITTTL